ncbi:MAG TPA: hypothetical protein P5089_01355 [Candidatus Portnoybacteria bacterium]|nr:hypothetical protein [Candidatus Portnoybacteria bacterium]
MGKVKLLLSVVVIFLALLFFTGFLAKNSLSKESMYNVFRAEVSNILYDVSPDEKSFEIIKDSVAFVLEENNQEMMISIFVKAPGQERPKLIWVIEESRLNNKNVTDLAERAAYIILFHLSKKALPEIIIPSAQEPIKA